MKFTLACLVLISLCGQVRAEDDGPKSGTAPTASAQPANAQQIQRLPDEAAGDRAGSAGAKDAPGNGSATEKSLFDTEARWSLAGYNLEEVVYTILITNRDTRILRCSMQLSGSYYENGQKLSISDRQSVTIFPEQQQQAGTWLGMDEKSGATYAVKCHPL
jgi:hypothetical protein